MFSDPVKNLKQLGLRENMIVADLGAGTGFYAIPAAKIVSSGKVYAIEIIRDYVHTIKNKAKEEHIKNLECFWSNIEEPGGTKLKNGIVDVAIVSNVLFQVEDRERLLMEIKRILKSSGQVMLIEWSDKAFPLGPKKESLVSKKEALDIFEKHGFMFEREIDVGSHHYGIIFKNK